MFVFVRVQSWIGPTSPEVWLKVSLPEIDGAIEPLIFSGRDGTSGRSIPMQARVQRAVGLSTHEYH